MCFVPISPLHAIESAADCEELLLCRCELDSTEQSCHIRSARIGR